MRTLLTANPDSTVILGETLPPGRVAHDEAHVYDVYWAETEARRPGGTVLFADVLRLNPVAGDDPVSIGRLGSNDASAPLCMVTGRIDPAAVVA